MVDVKKYTEDDDNWLIANYSNATFEEMQERLHRSKAAIYTRAASLGLKRVYQDAYKQEEIKWMLDNYSTATWDEIKNNIRRSDQSIRTLASKLGIQREMCVHAHYTDKEDDLIREYYSDMGIDEFVALYMPWRTVPSVYARAQRLCVRQRKDWTAEEDEWLRDNYYKMPPKELSKLFVDRSVESIKNRMEMLGLLDAPAFKYTNKDIKYVTDNYDSITDKEIGNALHRTPGAIKELRRKLGLTRKKDGIEYGILDYLSRNNGDWKARSMNACGYRCVVTGGRFDDIHHLYAKNLILRDALENIGMAHEIIDVNNTDKDIVNMIANEFYIEQDKHPIGLCLSKSVHKDFHDRYGYGGNTPEQFYEYVKTVAPDKLDMIIDIR